MFSTPRGSKKRAHMMLSDRRFSFPTYSTLGDAEPALPYDTHCVYSSVFSYDARCICFDWSKPRLVKTATIFTRQNGNLSPRRIAFFRHILRLCLFSRVFRRHKADRPLRQLCQLFSSLSLAFAWMYVCIDCFVLYVYICALPLIIKGVCDENSNLILFARLSRIHARTFSKSTKGCTEFIKRIFLCLGLCLAGRFVRTELLFCFLGFSGTAKITQFQRWAPAQTPLPRNYAPYGFSMPIPENFISLRVENLEFCFL